MNAKSLCALVSGLLSVLLWSGPNFGAEDILVADKATGCRIFKVNAKPTDTVTWTGKCASGLADGPGSAQWFSSGQPEVRFDGTFKGGRLQGKGVMVGSSGDRYEGDYKDGMRDGRGVYIFANGGRYEGDYKANLRDGKGVLTDTQGNRMAVEFRNGQKIAETPAFAYNKGTAATKPVTNPLVDSTAPSRPSADSAGGAVTPPGASGGPTRKTTKVESNPGSSSEKFSFAMNACTATFTNVFGIIPRSIDLKSGPSQGQYTLSNMPPALRPILEDASRYASEHCATKQCDPQTAFAVTLFYDRMPRLGEDSANWDPKPVINAKCPSGGTTNPRWEIFNAIAYDESAEGKAAKQRQQQLENAKSANVEWLKKSKAFFEKYGVAGIYNAGPLNRNPFALQGKPVLLWAQLSQMLEANKALLISTDDFVVVSDVPRGAFGNGYYLFIGKVLGNTNYPGNLTQVPVTHLKFIDAVPCPTADASTCIK